MQLLGRPPHVWAGVCRSLLPAEPACLPSTQDFGSFLDPLPEYLRSSAQGMFDEEDSTWVQPGKGHLSAAPCGVRALADLVLREGPMQRSLGTPSLLSKNQDHQAHKMYSY